MKVLGLESSCDETAAAVVEDGCKVLADVISSQAAVHAQFGGVVPELAARHHVTNVIPVLEATLRGAGIELRDLDGIAVTRGPGLVGALLVAVQVAKAIAYAFRLPLVGVNHLEGHLTAVYLDAEATPGFPHVALLVSGGHTCLVQVNGYRDFHELGATRDDAAGEAFDKVAKLLGLGYPGGAVIDRLAQDGDAHAVRMPLPMDRRGDLEFSFSGLKTWVRNWVAQRGIPQDQELADLCASFQHTVVMSLVNKTREAVRVTGVHAIQVAGGVAANRYLRATMKQMAEEEGIDLFIPKIRHCTDNAAMIAAAGYHRLITGGRDGLDLNAQAHLPFVRAT